MNIRHQKAIDEIPYSLLNLMQQSAKHEKQTRCYGTDTIIHFSEIHIISAIAKNPDINVKGLADLLEITSASVSEILTKLETKGFVIKKIDTDNLKSLKINLTTKGKLAHEEHMKYHKEIDAVVKSELTSMTEEQLKMINTFLSNLTTKLGKLKF